ncbi:MAG TPA: haloacid dehalogenase-like hydrolase [Gaiellaceae bacterium]|nr:haloacid dehalogenase-like hydrolase [Gaiellaceae bacterium]
MRLVLDWDGTVTERDTLDLVLAEFGDAEIYERVESELEAGRMTLDDVIAAEFATVTVPLEEAVAYAVEHTRVRPGFAELARARRPLVVSSGFHELIEPVLEREGVIGEVELRANRVEARPEGWRVRFRVAEICDECGEACKRADLPPGEVVFAGDGHSDYCASLAADRVFATAGLARFLERRGVAHEPLTDFYALASEL